MLKYTLLASLLLVGIASADVRYTSKVSMGAAGSPGMEMRQTTSIKGKRQRTDTITQMGPNMKMTSSQLTLCDKKQYMNIDDELKIYSVRAFDAPVPGQPSKKGTGTVTMTYNVEDRGKEKIAGVEARHYLITTRTQSTGCAGELDTTSKVEIWTAPIQALDCPETYGYTPVQGCKVTFTQKGDAGKVAEAYRGMIVKQITYVNNQPMSTTEMTEYSTAALSDSVFGPGPGYKQVSEAEFQQQQQQKMMKMYQQPPGQ